MFIRFALILLLLAVDAEAQRRGRGAPPGQRRGRGDASGSARVEPRSYTFVPTGERMSYVVYVSPKIDRTKPSPLVIVLHGLNTTPEAFLPRVVSAVPDTKYILVAPMGYNVTGWYGANGANGIGQGRQTGTPANLGELSEKDVMHVLELARTEFLIDPRRIYIMGNSMGGAGAIHLGLKHPDIWAAVGARAAAIRGWIHQPDELAKAPALPMVLVHGDADRSVPVAQSRQWAAKMKELKMTYEYHELKNVGHGVDPDGVRRIFSFFDKHAKR